ncbi:MAG: hypothetical protein ACLQM6_08785 [Acidobacteriaceae bacterium]
MNESLLRLFGFSSTVVPGQSFGGQASPSTLAIAKGQIYTRIFGRSQPNWEILHEEENASTVLSIFSYMPLKLA